LAQAGCLKTYLVEWRHVTSDDDVISGGGEMKVFSASYRHAWFNELRAMTSLHSNRCYTLAYLWYSAENPFTADIAQLCGDVICDKTP